MCAMNYYYYYLVWLATKLISLETSNVCENVVWFYLPETFVLGFQLIIITFSKF